MIRNRENSLQNQQILDDQNHKNPEQCNSLQTDKFHQNNNNYYNQANIKYKKTIKINNDINPGELREGIIVMIRGDNYLIKT